MAGACPISNSTPHSADSVTQQSENEDNESEMGSTLVRPKGLLAYTTAELKKLGFSCWNELH